MAYLDSSSTKQAGFNQLLSNYYRNHEKKLLVSHFRPKIFNQFF